MTLRSTGPKGENDREFDVLVIAAGRDPNINFLSNTLASDTEKLEGEGLLYLIGDVRNGQFRQAAVAAGDGIRAAMEIEQSLLREAA